MIETDAREFRDRDGQDGEIDAGDPEAERQKADEGAGKAATGTATSRPIHGPMPKCT